MADISPHSAVAVGTRPAATPGHFQNWMMRWDGSTWTQVTSPDKGNLVDILNGVAAGPAGVWTAGIFSIASVGQRQAAAGVFGTVPSVTGQPQAAAVDAMNAAGLGFTITNLTIGTGTCNVHTNGNVLSTTPAAGVFAAAPVNLSVCHLPPNVVVPSVVLLGEGSARVTLITKGLAVGTVTTVANCAVAKGTVLSQSPAARVTVALGTPVDLTEASGLQPNGQPCP